MDEPSQSKVLLVEDDEELRFILKPHLRGAGFEVVEARDGAEAIRLAQEDSPDIIIMDIGLPVIDGISATRSLKDNPRTRLIPVIMLTARARTDDVVRGLEAGAQEYVLKPFDVSELIARVKTVHRITIAQRELDHINNELEAEVDVKRQRLQQLYDFMRELNRANSQDRILDLVVRAAQEMTGAKRLSLLLVDPTGEKLVCERAVGIDPDVVEQIDISTVEGIAGKVYQSGKTLAAKTYGLTARTEQGYNRDAFVSTPLVSAVVDGHDTIVGVLNVTEKQDDTPFSEDEIECIRSIADAATIAFDNVIRQGQLKRSVRILLKTVGQLAEFRDEETTRHIERVAHMSRVLGEELAKRGPYLSMVSREFIDLLVQAAPMHDIGKVGISDDILTKPGKLTDEEYQIMKTHTDIGRRVLSQAIDPAHPVPLLQMCVDIAYCHHERYDGKGYPRRIAGDDIPLAARIIALVDAYDAITSERRYKRAKSHEEAVEIILSEKGNHFDPHIVEAFARCHKKFDQLRARYPDTDATVNAPAV